MNQEYVQQLADHLYWVPGGNGARFPYCHSYLWVDDAQLVAFDPQCGQTQLRQALKSLGHKLGDITSIVCTHFHIDHSSSNVPLREKSGAEIWIHELDAPALRDLDNFVARYGMENEQMVALWQKFLVDFGVRPHEVDHEIRDGDIVPGNFRAIHTPGHTPGHCCFYKDGILIAGDIDLTVPWLGNLSSNAGDFIASIERLQQMDIQMLLPGHGVPVLELIQEGLEEFRQKLLRRETQLLEVLDSESLTLDEIATRVDQAKAERRGQEEPTDRSPFAQHFHHMSILNSLKHLQETGHVDNWDENGRVLWKVI